MPPDESEYYKIRLIMLKIIITFLLLTTNIASATELSDEINNIEYSWAKIYYSKQNSAEKQAGYQTLIDKVRTLKKQFPASKEAIFWEANLLASRAEHDNLLRALFTVKQAIDLLKSVIASDATTLDGAALVTLAIIYSEIPLPFKDKIKAEKLFKKALQINPKSVDPNYFYAKFLRSSNRNSEAKKYFRLASRALIRSEQQYADGQLRNKALDDLKAME